MSGLLAVVTVAVLARFASSARVGARVRGLTPRAERGGGPARAVASLRDGLARVSPRFVTVGALAGAAIAGTSGALGGALMGTLVEPMRARRALARREALMRSQLPDTLRTVTSALHAGRSLPQAIADARDATRAPLRPVLDAVARRLDGGMALDEAVRPLDEVGPEGTAVADILRLAPVAGSALPAVIDATVESLVERERSARDHRAATAQARLSAIVVGAMPLGFFVLAGSGGRAQLAFLTREPVGWVLLSLGITLEAAGVLWMRSVLRPR